ncbi:MAG: DUF2497 domain-containing protein [Pseudomonadota bacterium]
MSGAEKAQDPSMDDILSSIRRMISDEPAAAAPARSAPMEPAAHDAASPDVAQGEPVQVAAEPQAKAGGLPSVGNALPAASANDPLGAPGGPAGDRTGGPTGGMGDLMDLIKDMPAAPVAAASAPKAPAAEAPAPTGLRPFEDLLKSQQAAEPAPPAPAPTLAPAAPSEEGGAFNGAGAPVFSASPSLAGPSLIAATSDPAPRADMTPAEDAAAGPDDAADASNGAFDRLIAAATDTSDALSVAPAGLNGSEALDGPSLAEPTVAAEAHSAEEPTHGLTSSLRALTEASTFSASTPGDANAMAALGAPVSADEKAAPGPTVIASTAANDETTMPFAAEPATLASVAQSANAAFGAGRAAIGHEPQVDALGPAPASDLGDFNAEDAAIGDSDHEGAASAAAEPADAPASTAPAQEPQAPTQAEAPAPAIDATPDASRALAPTNVGQEVLAPDAPGGPRLPEPASRSLEDAVAELLRPMLREWLDANMPRIVEKALRVELAEGAQRTNGTGKAH